VFATDPARLGRLGIDDARAGMRVSSQHYSQALA
jgi:hypothetical protein